MDVGKIHSELLSKKDDKFEVLEVVNKLTVSWSKIFACGIIFWKSSDDLEQSHK